MLALGAREEQPRQRIVRCCAKLTIVQKAIDKEKIDRTRKKEYCGEKSSEISAISSY